MFSRIKQHFTPSTAIAVLALVFAATGGAFAASGSGAGSGARLSASVTRGAGGNPISAAAKSKPKPKAKTGPRGPAGPKGATGATGPAGPAGATGPTGAMGPGGPQGPQGLAGTNGANGTNGTDGVKGETGSPWTAGGTLPSEKSEQGEWSAVYEATAANQPMSSAISFTIPLETAPKAAFFIGTNEELAGEKNAPKSIKEGECKGSVEKPEAAPGYLCAFAGKDLNGTIWKVEGLDEIRFSDPQTGTAANGTEEAGGVGPGGSVLLVGSEAAGLVLANGTWVVTAE